jgi:hypothetical protein
MYPTLAHSQSTSLATFCRLSLETVEFQDLFRLLGASDAPSLNAIAEWLEVLAQPHVPLGERELATAIALLKLFVESKLTCGACFYSYLKSFEFQVDH